MQAVVELEEHQWRMLSGAVIQRLKRLMAGVADPGAVKRDNEARKEHAEHVAKHRAEAQRQRQIERQR